MGGHRARFSGILLTDTVFKRRFQAINARSQHAQYFHCRLIYHVEVDFVHMYGHLCCTKHGRKSSNLLDTQKVDGDEGRLMCGPLP